MAKCYLDSNILIYWLNSKSPFNKKATEILTTLRKNGNSLFISPLVLDEFIHSVVLGEKLNHAKNPHLIAKNKLHDLLSLPSLTIVNPPIDPQEQEKIIEFMENYSLRPRDAYHLLIMRTNNIGTFATFDSDFKKVFAAKLLTTHTL